MVWLVAWCLLVLGLVFLARDAEATGWIRRIIRQRAEVGRSSHGNLASRFLDAWLSCSPCIAAWMSFMAGGMVWGLYLLRDTPWFVPMLAPAGAVGAVGLMYGFTLLSPSQAMAAALAGLGRLGKGKKDAEGKT
jgi:hypothetical protein